MSAPKRTFTSSLIFIGLVFSFYFMQAQSRIDSLVHELEVSETDSLKVKTLIQLWEATAYTDNKKAAGYSKQALDLSKQSGYERGIAESWLRIAIQFNNAGKIDSTAFYYTRALEKANKINARDLAANILMDIGILYYSQGRYNEAQKFSEQSLKKLSALNDEHGIAMILSLLGNINHYSGNYLKAQKYQLQSLDLFKKLKDETRIADGLVYLASNYQALEKYDQALLNLHQACQIYDKLKDIYYLSQACNNLGFIQQKLGNRDSAMYYYQQSIQFAKTSGNRSTLALALTNRAGIYIESAQADPALRDLDTAQKIAVNENDQLRLAEIFNKRGNLFVLQKHFQKAIDQYKQSLSYSRRVGAKDDTQEAFLDLSDAYSGMKDYHQALIYFKKHSNLKDSIYNEKKTRIIEEMEARYEKGKKDNEIALHKTNIRLLQKNLEVETFRRKVWIVGFILLGLLGLIGGIALRQRMRGHRKIREQERRIEKEKLQIAHLQRDKYEQELEFKKNELTARALQIAQKNELLDSLKKQFVQLEKNPVLGSQPYRQFQMAINGSAQTDKDWKNFNKHFEQVHQGFYTKLKSKSTELTANDLRFAAMIRMNLSSKEIGSIMHISPESVRKARYRLKKKLQIESKTDIHTYIMGI